TALAGLFRDRLATGIMAGAEADDLARQLGRLARTTAIQELLADRLRDPEAPRSIRLLVLRAMAQSGLKQAPQAWLEVLPSILADRDGDIVREAVTTARALPMPKQPPEKLV